MSLVVALADAYGILLASDTRAFSKADGPLPKPVCKLRIFCVGRAQWLVGVAGESEINGVNLFDQFQRWVQSREASDSIDVFRDFIQEEWRKDVDSHPWDPGERDAYLQVARITLSFVDSPRSMQVVDGVFGALKVSNYEPPRTVLAFGMPDLVRSRLECPPGDRPAWRPYLAELYREASSLSNLVGYPVDTAEWCSAGPAQIVRYVDFDTLQKG